MRRQTSVGMESVAFHSDRALSSKSVSSLKLNTSAGRNGALVQCVLMLRTVAAAPVS